MQWYNQDEFRPVDYQALVYEPILPEGQLSNLSMGSVFNNASYLAQIVSLRVPHDYHPVLQSFFAAVWGCALGDAALDVVPRIAKGVTGNYHNMAGYARHAISEARHLEESSWRVLWCAVWPLGRELDRVERAASHKDILPNTSPIWSRQVYH